MVWLENVNLPSATFAKFQPQSVDFLEITNPKALYPYYYCMLECLLQNVNIKLRIPYNREHWRGKTLANYWQIAKVFSLKSLISICHY